MSAVLGLVAVMAAVTMGADAAPRVMQRAGYPKLSRCASPIQVPDAPASYAPGCLAWRDAELARLSALSVPDRIARVAVLRERMGLSPGQGLGITLDGRLRPSEASYARD